MKKTISELFSWLKVDNVYGTSAQPNINVVLYRLRDIGVLESDLQSKEE